MWREIRKGHGPGGNHFAHNQPKRENANSEVMEHSRTSRELCDKASQTDVPWCLVLRKHESTGNHKFEFDVRDQMECRPLQNLDDRCFLNEDNLLQQFLRFGRLIRPDMGCTEIVYYWDTGHRKAHEM
jgi:hypothetical protein